MNSQKKILPKLYPANKEIKRVWYIEYLGKDGKRKKVYGRLNKLPTIQQRITEAEFLITQIQAEDLQAPNTGAGNQLLNDLQAVFDMKLPYWKPKTVSAYQTHLYSFARWYRQAGCPAMDARQALLFLNTISQGNNNTTRNNYRKNLKGLFNALIRYYKKRYTDNPFKEVDKAPEMARTKEWFRPVIMEKVKTFIAEDKQVFLAAKILYHCFVRPNEIRLLRCADIIHDTKKIRIESNTAKSKRTRFVPIPESLYNELKPLQALPASLFLFGVNGCPGAAIPGRDNLSKRHKELLKPLQLGKGFTFYSWKNTGAVKMLMQDKKPMRYISKCMGHHSLDMTDKYFESLGVDEMGDTIIFPEM
jgi:integrase